MKKVTFKNNVFLVMSEHGTGAGMHLTDDDAREVVRVLSSQLTPVAADLAPAPHACNFEHGLHCPTCGKSVF